MPQNNLPPLTPEVLNKYRVPTTTKSTNSSLPPLTKDVLKNYMLPVRPTTIRPGTAPPPDMNEARQNLGTSTNLRLNTFSSNGQDWSNLSPARRMAMSNVQTVEAKKEADYANSPLGFAGNFLSAVKTNTAKILLDPAATFAKSVVDIPETAYKAATGQSMEGMGKFTLPSGEQGQSFEGKAADATALEASGKDTSSPLAETADITGGVIGGAADILGAGEIAGSKVFKKVSEVAGEKLAASAEKSATKEALKVVTPELSEAETVEALRQGRVSKGSVFKKSKVIPDKRLLEVADVTSGIVKKNVTAAENISNVKNALSKEANSLANSVEEVKQPVSENGVRTWLDNVEKPIEIKSDTTLNNKFDITKDALMKIINKNLTKDANVSSLLKSRKEFDILVDKQFPTLYDRNNAPFRSAVTGMRNALNNAIEANLPDGFGYKESLKKQSLFYDAIDNISSKSAAEVGKSGVGRFAAKHPKAVAAVGTAAAGALGAAGYEAKKAFAAQ